MIPKSVALHKKSRVLELKYENQAPIMLDAEYLRVFSPSAEVRGHHPSQAVLQYGKLYVGIDAIEPVGNYALQISFDDGHSSGIYSWEYLFKLGQQHENNWRDYLQQLAQAGKSRDPQVQVVNLVDPRAIDPSQGGT